RREPGRLPADGGAPRAAARRSAWSGIPSGPGQSLDLGAASGTAAFRTGRTAAACTAALECLGETGVTATTDWPGTSIGETGAAAASQRSAAAEHSETVATSAAAAAEE